MGTQNLPQPDRVRRILDRQLFIRLRENEIDLQIELADLADEILTREARIGAVLAALQTTRAEMRRWLRDAA